MDQRELRGQGLACHRGGDSGALKPTNAIWGSLLFGGLFVLDIYLPGLTRATKELVRVFPYVVTLLVLIITSKRNKPENQPPESLGRAFFREER